MVNSCTINTDLSWDTVSHKAKKIPSEILQLSHVEVTIKATRLVSHTVNATKELFGVSRDTQLIKGMCFTALACIPISFINIAAALKGVKTTVNEKIDAALDIIGELGSIGVVAEAFGECLVYTKVVAEHAVKWLTPVSIIGSALELCSLVLTIKRYVETHIFSKKLHQQANLDKTSEEYTLEDYQNGIDFLDQVQMKEKSSISKLFNTDENKLADRLVAIETEARESLRSQNTQRIAKSNSKMHSAMKTLSKRLFTTKLSHVLTGISAVVGAVAFIILLASPAAPAAFALLGVGAAIGIGKFIMNKVMTHRFEKELGLNKT